MASRTASDVGPFTYLMRLVVRKIAMHICLTLGLIGNTLTLITLFHKRMRYSSTASYLAALTIFDTLYLIGIFIVNLESNYPKSGNSSLYQILLLIAYPLSDFCSNTSTYLTLIFTIERYLAVKFPLRARYLCRPSRARKIILIIIIFCFCLTFPTLLENKIEYYYDTNLNRTRAHLIKMQIYSNFEQYTIIYFWLIAVCVQFIPLILLIIFNSLLIIYVHNSRNKYLATSALPIINGANHGHDNNNKNNKNGAEMCDLVLNRNLKSQSITSLNIMNNKTAHRLSNASLTGLGTPLTTTGTGNDDMRVHRFNYIQLYQEQRKGIILLIVIVLVFVLCQLPSALLLIREALYPVRFIGDRTKSDIIIGFNNIANGLLHVNASINFVLYCVFSDKFRTTFKIIFCGNQRNTRSAKESEYYKAQHPHHQRNTQHFYSPQTFKRPSDINLPYKLSNLSLNVNPAVNLIGFKQQTNQQDEHLLRVSPTRSVK